jgi:hypothetical protein
MPSLPSAFGLRRLHLIRIGRPFPFLGLSGEGKTTIDSQFPYSADWDTLSHVSCVTVGAPPWLRLHVAPSLALTTRSGDTATLDDPPCL